MRSTIALLALSTLGCGSSPAPTVPPTQLATNSGAASASAPPVAASALVLAKESTANTRELALTELAPQLAEFLVGKAWAPMLEHASLSGTDWATWLINNDVVHQNPTSGRFAATLSRTQVEHALNEFGSCTLPVQHLQLPTAWQPTLVHALIAERQWSLCQRKQQLLKVPCELPTPLDERLAVTGLIADVALQPLLPDGIPVRGSGEVVWPIEVQVVSQSNGRATGLAGVPLRLVAPVTSPNDAPPADTPLADATDALSDAQGIVHVAQPQWAAPVQVDIVNKLLLGPFATLTELPHVLVHTRPLDVTRQTIVEVSDATPGKTPTVGLGAILTRELSLVYGKPLIPLATKLTEIIKRAPSAATVGKAALEPDVRKRIVESTRGSVDYVVLVAGDAEFASQMGADRTWYEANARAQVVEVWSGNVVAEFHETGMGSGFGDQAAEQAAQLAVVQKLRTRLQTWRGP